MVPVKLLGKGGVNRAGHRINGGGVQLLHPAGGQIDIQPGTGAVAGNDKVHRNALGNTVAQRIPAFAQYL
ncbi:hypothetical protein SDC9_171191 [bioreactor metagenome]|uniref:Uncharacterized protein n=1 Tax=bioreactor metagenome TaxID=1076179 RepID=A0A645GA72_9ZZZZ